MKLPSVCLNCDLSEEYICPGCLLEVTRASPPNFLLLLADDFGYSDVSWNNPAMVTPALAALARDGVVLDT